MSLRDTYQEQIAITDLSIEEWANKFKIKLDPKPCLKCGKLQNFTKPFAYKDFRGFESDHDECGEEYRQSIFVSIDKEWNEMLEDTFRNLSARTERG